MSSFLARACVAGVAIVSGSQILSHVMSNKQIEKGQDLQRVIPNLSDEVIHDEVWCYCLLHLHPLSEKNEDAKFLFQHLVDVINSIHHTWLLAETMEQNPMPTVLLEIEKDMQNKIIELKRTIHMFLHAAGIPSLQFPAIGEEFPRLCDLPVDSDTRTVVEQLLFNADTVMQNTLVAHKESYLKTPFAEVGNLDDTASQIRQRYGITSFA